MTHRQFGKQLDQLEWSLNMAAKELGVPAGKARVGEWRRGARAIPPYIVAHMKTLKELREVRDGVVDAIATGLRGD